MSDIFNSIILGIVEGITEFLPVSSTGHLIVTQEILGFQGSDTFEIVIQLGGVLAVLWFYFQTLWQQAKTVRDDRQVQRFWMGVILAFLPWLDRSPVKSIRYRGPIFKAALTIFVIAFFILGYLGVLPPTPGRTLVSQICSVIYFAFFLLMPVYSKMDKTKPVPERVS